MESLLVDVDGVDLHVGSTGAGAGAGADIVVLSGGPGCVHYLERDDLWPEGHRWWFPEPRGVGRSQGGPHTMATAVADLEAVREAVGADRWVVLGHSWGADLAVRYALDHPGSVTAVVGIGGRGPQRDRHWSEAYEAGRDREPVVPIAWVPEVHAALGESFTEWIHRPDLWRRIANSPVPLHLVAAGDDIRPAWPLEQLATAAPHGSFEVVAGVPHDFWSTRPDVWRDVVARVLAHL